MYVCIYVSHAYAAVAAVAVNAVAVNVAVNREWSDVNSRRVSQTKSNAWKSQPRVQWEMQTFRLCGGRLQVQAPALHQYAITLLHLRIRGTVWRFRRRRRPVRSEWGLLRMMLIARQLSWRSLSVVAHLCILPSNLAYKICVCGPYILLRRIFVALLRGIKLRRCALCSFDSTQCDVIRGDSLTKAAA